jgi:hypothetical protein
VEVELIRQPFLRVVTRPHIYFAGSASQIAFNAADSCFLQERAAAAANTNTVAARVVEGAARCPQHPESGFTMRLTDYAALGGHMESIIPLSDVLKRGPARLIRLDATNPWPLDGKALLG